MALVDSTAEFLLRVSQLGLKEDSTDKIACANCHLAQEEIDVHLPQEVLPNTIFRRP